MVARAAYASWSALQHDVFLIVNKQRSKLAKDSLRCPISSTIIPCTRSVLRQELSKGFHTTTILNQRTDIDLTAKIVAYCALVVVQRGNKQQVQERRSIASARNKLAEAASPCVRGDSLVEYGLCHLMTSSDCFHQSLDRRHRGPRALQESAILTNRIVLAVLRRPVEFLGRVNDGTVLE